MQKASLCPRRFKSYGERPSSLPERVQRGKEGVSRKRHQPNGPDKEKKSGTGETACKSKKDVPFPAHITGNSLEWTGFKAWG